MIKKIEDQKMMMHVNFGKIEATIVATSKLINKFQGQLNLFDRNKIGYNFVYMYASPPYLLLKNKTGERRVAFPKLKYHEEFVSI